MKRPACLLIAALMSLMAMSADALADIAARATVELKPNPIVVGRMITFSDLFRNAGDAASTEVIAAPRPGERISIDAISLASLARDHGLDWENLAALRTVDVTRASRDVDAETISKAITEALSEKSGGRDLEVNLLQSGIMLKAQIDDPSPPQVTIRSFDPQSGRFQVQISVPGGDHAIINGTADEVMSVPVLARPFQRGEVIQEADLTWQRMRIDTLTRQVVTDPASIVGLSARRPLRSGQAIMTSDIEHPVVVTKGSLVTMSYKVPGMTLTDLGRAQQQGAIGDTINVLNQRSHRTVQAVVVAENAVELSPIAPAALTAQANISQ